MANLGNIELLQVIETVAREKAMPKETVFVALEKTVKAAASRKYGCDQALKAKIDRGTGEIKLYKEMLVVAEDFDVTDTHLSTPEEVDPSNSVNLHQREQTEDVDRVLIRLSEAKLKEPTAEVGDLLYEPLPPLELTRLSAQTAKQTIVSQVREIEKTLQYEEYKDRVGELVQGVVDKVEFGNLIVKIRNAEAILRRDQLLQSDHYRQGDRVRACLKELNPNAKGPQLILSRTDEGFLAELLRQEVPEIYDRIIEIKGIARDPGSRAKVAVFSEDAAIDPIGACIGVRGVRIQSVISELNGEKIDILQWSSDLATFIMGALAPINVIKIVIDEENNRVEVIVAAEDLSMVIGRRGQNVRLTSTLVGWNITVLTEEEEISRRQEDFQGIIKKFVQTLDIEEILAQLLVTEGYTSINALANASKIDLAAIQGLDEEIADELITRARDYESSTHMAVDKTVNGPVGSFVSKDIMRALRSCGIKNIRDLAELSRDELSDILINYDKNLNLNTKDLDRFIMDARHRVGIAK